MGLWAQIVAVLNGETRSPQPQAPMFEERAVPRPELPLLVFVPMDRGSDPRDDDTEIYSVNMTSRTWAVKLNCGFTPTADAETGGSAVLAPGEAARLGAITSFEWGAEVLIFVDYRPEGEDRPITADYVPSFGWGLASERIAIPSTGKDGQIRRPTYLRVDGKHLVWSMMPSSESLAARPPRPEAPLRWPPPIWYWVPFLVVLGVLAWRALGSPGG